MVVNIFNQLMGILRRQGRTMEAGQYHALLLIVTLIYGAVSLVIVGAVASLSLKRAWERAIAPPPRHRAK